MIRKIALGLFILLTGVGCSHPAPSARLQQAEKDYVYYEMGQQVLLVVPSDDLFLRDHPSRVDPALYPFVQYIAQMINFDDPHEVEVMVYANGIALPKEALQMTQAQANTVAAFLWSQGVPKHRLSYHGFGTTLPIANEINARSAFQNSHVEFRWWMSEEAYLKHTYDKVKKNRLWNLTRLYAGRADRKAHQAWQATENEAYLAKGRVDSVNVHSVEQSLGHAKNDLYQAEGDVMAASPQ